MSKEHTFYLGAVECLLWSEGLDDFSLTDIPDEDLNTIKSECDDFMAACMSMLVERAESTSWAQMGHDFILTRNGHGAGYWDRGYPHDQELTELAKPYGAVHVDMDVERKDELIVYFG